MRLLVINNYSKRKMLSKVFKPQAKNILQALVSITSHLEPYILTE